MDDKLIDQLRQLVILFQDTWAERDAYRLMHTDPKGGRDTANLETIWLVAKTRAQDLFRPALCGLGADIPQTLVLEKLLESLREAHK